MKNKPAAKTNDGEAEFVLAQTLERVHLAQRLLSTGVDNSNPQGKNEGFQGNLNTDNITRNLRAQPSDGLFTTKHHYI